jgi:hypothetical protein
MFMQITPVSDSKMRKEVNNSFIIIPKYVAHKYLLAFLSECPNSDFDLFFPFL